MSENKTQRLTQSIKASIRAGSEILNIYGTDHTIRKLLDVSRISSLGWSPKISLSQGIRSTYDDYKRSSE